MLRAAVVIAAVAAAVVPLNPVRIERWYSTGFYPRLQAIVTTITNGIPISLLDVAVGIGIVAAALVIRRRVTTLGPGRALLKTGLSLLFVTAGVYLTFLLMWGLNYRRLPLDRKLPYDKSAVTRSAAVALAGKAAEAMNAGYADAHGVRWDPRTLEAPFDRVQRLLGATRGAVPGIPKRSLLSFYFRRAAIDGMTDPFFLEIIVNRDLLDIERPFVIAHEWAHLAGYADESEANFVAWVTCLGGDPLARYSGWVSAYEYAMRPLTPVEQRGATGLAEGPRGDLRAMAARYARSSPTVREAANGVYDGYLRANRVEEGIGSYEAVLRLMLGARLGPEWTAGVQ
ncbi:MAG: hypothetical protein V7647_176 [Acidobacteriota bacterium]|jgi:hypothetical protein